MPQLVLEEENTQQLLQKLIGKDIHLTELVSKEIHPSTLRGLVTDENELVALIGSDLPFAHFSGAALAMVPLDAVDADATSPDEDLLEVYGEVANVLSRVVNEALPERVRIDPGLDHPVEELAQVIKQGELAFGCAVNIDGYGAGVLAVWHRPVS
ncbi:MAG: hypothetical protein GY745_15805 [Actinomycetia bacterium]|nr:hypothetical protein [Actinomycetes bacterium]MCP3913538.1 hypothetical protein [Actinomycetes bacterium]MCP4086500.1 hypothetical protein [Actinomycetes bacterium]